MTDATRMEIQPYLSENIQGQPFLKNNVKGCGRKAKVREVL